MAVFRDHNGNLQLAPARPSSPGALVVAVLVAWAVASILRKGRA